MFRHPHKKTDNQPNIKALAKTTRSQARAWHAVILMGSGLMALASAPACGGPKETEPKPATTTTTTQNEEAQAQKQQAKEQTSVSPELQAQWKRHKPDGDWVQEQLQAHTIIPPADNRHLIGDPQGQTYGRVTQRDVETWEREIIKFVAEGSRIFHSADELGSTIAVSCDMCHPDGANTHPETYPKFQIQMGRVALLRDMINWCIEQAIRGEPLAQNDPKLRALEAYIYAQRTGTPLRYGKR